MTQYCTNNPVVEQDAFTAGDERAAPLPTTLSGCFLVNLNGHRSRFLW